MLVRGAVALAVALTLASCRGEEPAPAVASPAVQAPESLKDVSLPAMNGVDASLAERIRANEAALTALRGQSGVSDADRAEAFGRVGKLLLGAGFQEHAEPYLLNAQALAPREMSWPYYLAQAARLRHDPDRAIAHFQQVLTLQPEYVPALIWLGTMEIDRGRLEEAEPLLTKAAALRPQDAAARFGLGRTALAASDYRRAASELEAALSADPKADTVRYALAMAYRGLGDERRASEEAARWRNGNVYPADPLMEEIGQLLKTAVSFEVMGTRALDQQKWSEAIGYFRRGLEIAPRDATLHQNLGAALYLSGDARGAEREFTEALRLLPGYARAEFSLGVLRAGGPRDQDAIAHFEAALRSDPSLVNAHLALADAFRRNDRVEQSLDHYRQVFTADPAAGQARFGFAMALVRLGRHQEARAALEESARLFDGQPGFPHALARVLAASPDARVRDGARAVALVTSLRKRYATSPALDETEAMALAETGRMTEAVAMQRRAMTAAERAGQPDLARRMQENLRRYESGMPCRQPWADDDPVHRPGASALAGF